ncbi:MAG TPA: type II secretion system protein N [Methylomirabilota bacterium]
MMPKKLLIINALLLTIAAGSVVFIVRQLMAPLPMPPAARRPPPTAPAPVAEEPRSPVSGAYATVAARNLFSPTRTEAPPTATAAAASPAGKPNLYGVVLREGAPIAYLEDPATKRVAAYRVGDNVGGGTVQTIRADSVVINRPDGQLDVRLRDPSRPRPTPIPAAAVAPGARPAQPVGAQPALPGVIPPAAAAAPPPGQVMPQPGVVPPSGQAGQPVMPSVIPGRRPLPPNLLRRLPQGLPPNAPQQ